MGIVNPCKNCKSRHKACHAECPQYAAFRILSEQVRAARKHESDLNDITARGAEKMRTIRPLRSRSRKKG